MTSAFTVDYVTPIAASTNKCSHSRGGKSLVTPKASLTTPVYQGCTYSFQRNTQVYLQYATTFRRSNV
jgi:predicted porin